MDKIMEEDKISDVEEAARDQDGDIQMQATEAINKTSSTTTPNTSSL
jgi:hypothetical protein